MLEKLIKDDKGLSELFIEGKRIPDPFKTKRHKQNDTYEGKTFPTFYEPVHPHPSDKPQMAELGRAVRLQFKTDAENQYFTREKERGYIEVNCSKFKELSWYGNLSNGKHNITIDIPKITELGQQLVIEVTVGNDSRPELFVHFVFLEVVPKRDHPLSSPNPKPKPPGPDLGPDVPDQGALAMPNLHAVGKNQWEKHGFDKYSGLKIHDGGEDGYDYYYNRDNFHLRRAQKRSRDPEAGSLERKFCYALVFIGMWIMKETGVEQEKRLQQVESITRLLSPVLLPIINLGSIKPNED